MKVSLDVKIAEEARMKSEYNRRYRERNKEKLESYNAEYRENHKTERRLYDKARQEQHRIWQRERRLCTTLNNKRIYIDGLLKREYPISTCCELCKKPHLQLGYHHWTNTMDLLKVPKSTKHPLFLKGVWVCQPCNIFIHKLTEFPFLAEAWFALKETVDKRIVVYG